MGEYVFWSEKSRRRKSVELAGLAGLLVGVPSIPPAILLVGAGGLSTPVIMGLGAWGWAVVFGAFIGFTPAFLLALLAVIGPYVGVRTAVGRVLMRREARRWGADRCSYWNGWRQVYTHTRAQCEPLEREIEAQKDAWLRNEASWPSRNPYHSRARAGRVAV